MTILRARVIAHFDRPTLATPERGRATAAHRAQSRIALRSGAPHFGFRGSDRLAMIFPAAVVERFVFSKTNLREGDMWFPAVVIAGIAAVLAANGDAVARESCQRVGNQTYCSNGQLFEHFGNTTYDRHGNSWQRFGTQTYGSDRTLHQRSGGQTYDARGRPLQDFGRQTNEPTATSCERDGKVVICE